MAAMAADAAWMCYVGSITSSAAMQAAVYGAQGQTSTASVALQNSSISSICAPASTEMNNWQQAATSNNITINVAATGLNASTWTYTASCASSKYIAPPPFQADPEAAQFTINAVSVNAGFVPPINFAPFGIKSLSVPNIIYGRPVYMRQLN